jgi:acyl carrier protein
MKPTVEDVLGVLRQELDLDEGELSVSSSAEDVEFWDSLGHLRVCMALESRFGVQIPLDVVETLTSVGAILEFLDAESTR